MVKISNINQNQVDSSSNLSYIQFIFHLCHRGTIQWLYIHQQMVPGCGLPRQTDPTAPKPKVVAGKPASAPNPNAPKAGEKYHLLWNCWRHLKNVLFFFPSILFNTSLMKYKSHELKHVYHVSHQMFIHIVILGCQTWSRCRPFQAPARAAWPPSFDDKLTDGEKKSGENKHGRNQIRSTVVYCVYLCLFVFQKFQVSWYQSFCCLKFASM